ncbi:hypothetical protein CFAEC_08605 [Corynebacterium faecale]|nr:hypothetical protein CFAEC_08605 [Corynebacterium faecale]
MTMSLNLPPGWGNHPVGRAVSEAGVIKGIAGCRFMLNFDSLMGMKKIEIDGFNN